MDTHASPMNDVGAYYHRQGDLCFASKCYKDALLAVVSASKRAFDDDQIVKSQCRGLSNIDRGICILRLRQYAIKLMILDIQDIGQYPSELCNHSESDLIGMTSFLIPLEMKPNPVNIAPLLKRNASDICNHVETQADAIIVFNASIAQLGLGRHDTAAKLLQISLHLIYSRRECRKACSIMSNLEMMLHTNLGYLLYKSNMYKEAIHHFDKALSSVRGVTEEMMLQKNPCPEVMIASVRQIFCFSLNLARVYDATGMYDEAMVLVCEANVYVNTLNSMIPEEVIMLDFSGALYIKALIHHHKKEYRKSEKMYESYVMACHQGDRLLHKAAGLFGLGRVLFEQGNLNAAMTHLLKALVIQEDHFKADHYEVADTLFTIGRILHDQDEYTDALYIYKRAVKIQRRVLGSANESTLKTLCNIARIHRVQGESSEALAACIEAVQGGEDLLGQGHSFVIEMITMQGRLLHDLGRSAAASMVFERLEQNIDTLDFEPGNCLSEWLKKTSQEICARAA